MKLQSVWGRFHAQSQAWQDLFNDAMLVNYPALKHPQRSWQLSRLMQIKGEGGERRSYYNRFSIGCAVTPSRAPAGSHSDEERRDVRVPPHGLIGTLRIPRKPVALVVFAHGSGSSRLSPRNVLVASALNACGIATLLFDLLTPAEEEDRGNVFDIPLLAERLVEVIAWLDRDPVLAALPLGLFGASTGAAAALVAAGRLPDRVGAVVSRGGRPDLAGYALDEVHTPTLLIVGGDDFDVIDLNEHAMARLHGPKSLQIVPHATHLFPEPGALEGVIDHAARWFQQYLRRSRSASAPRQ